jgi:DNA-binding transcriptional regulator YhcF (GntR family)
VIDRRSDRAVFRQLADILRTQIEAGTLAPGAGVPSELRLSQEYDIARSTARQAIAVLRAEGLVTADGRRGYQVRRAELDAPPVLLKIGDRVTARMPSPTERRDHDLDEGVPLLVVRHADDVTMTYPGDRTLQVPRVTR